MFSYMKHYLSRIYLSNVILAILSIFLLLPVFSLLWMAFHKHSTYLWAPPNFITVSIYLQKTIILTTFVGIFSAILGVISAWLVTMTEFPGRKFFSWALLAPMAIPGYISAYTMVDFMDYAGPLQTAIRNIFHYTNSSQYYFPDFRSMHGAITILSFSLYPYVYFLAKASFCEHNGHIFQISRTFGHSIWTNFIRLTLPLSRPSIVTGMLLVIMEVVNDVGAISHFSIDTLTVKIFTIWTEDPNTPEIAHLSVYTLIFAFIVLSIEKMSRRNAKFYHSKSGTHHPKRIKLSCTAQVVASITCLLILSAGFIIPFITLMKYITYTYTMMLDPYFLQALRNTLYLAIITTASTLMIGTIIAVIHHMSQGKITNTFVQLSTLGYAIPGSVMAIGILTPVTAFDKYLFWNHEYFSFILSGSLLPIILAYTIRFTTISYGSSYSYLERLSPNIIQAASILEQNKMRVFTEIHAPLIQRSFITAGILIFIDACKELSIALIIRPFNYDTLAIQVYEFTGTEQLHKAAPAALIICLVGLLPVALLSYMDKENSRECAARKY